MSSTVLVSDLPSNCESSYVFTELRLQEDEIEEVYTQAGGGESVWIVFKAPELAATFENDHKGYHFGATGKKITTSFWTEAIPETATNRYSDFVRARDHQIDSRTVEITGLPEKHTLSDMNKLLESVRDQYVEATKQNQHLNPTDYGYYEPINILQVKTPDPGVGLLQLAQPWMAVEIVRQYAGTYWKNATLNARCVPDEEMDKLLVKEPSATDVSLFVRGVKVGISSKEVREIFKGFPITDVNILPGKTFCFVVVQQAHANPILAQFKNGVKWQGCTIKVDLSDKDKRKKKAEFGMGSATTFAAPTFAAPAPLPPTDITDLKLENLPYDVTDYKIRTLFEGFVVYKVVIKQGYAFVGIPTGEVGAAIDMLNETMIGAQYIKAKVAHPRKK
ncbi:uncharacterized protein J4E84_009775 [Alternaria hordeiaustralica]|uniref:uncharacterized protein n=1 Tax=Alternaria hordeiaustralica TaxID=1187925 RepID=UPI0020C49FB4|nr:uncharacterized protein J4E84_009775 [Alternaria hordeiaustralica]KAI4675976.1 hypothetical protein J4E84_009775 [Alternaria hordeiaustralica]